MDKTLEHAISQELAQQDHTGLAKRIAAAGMKAEAMRLHVQDIANHRSILSLKRERLDLKLYAWPVLVATPAARRRMGAEIALYAEGDSSDRIKRILQAAWMSSLKRSEAQYVQPLCCIVRFEAAASADPMKIFATLARAERALNGSKEPPTRWNDPTELMESGGPVAAGYLILSVVFNEAGAAAAQPEPSAEDRASIQSLISATFATQMHLPEVELLRPQPFLEALESLQEAMIQHYKRTAYEMTGRSADFVSSSSLQADRRHTVVEVVVGAGNSDSIPRPDWKWESTWRPLTRGSSCLEQHSFADFSDRANERHSVVQGSAPGRMLLN